MITHTAKRMYIKYLVLKLGPSHPVYPVLIARLRRSTEPKTTLLPPLTRANMVNITLIFTWVLAALLLAVTFGPHHVLIIIPLFAGWVSLTAIFRFMSQVSYE